MTIPLSPVPGGPDRDGRQPQGSEPQPRSLYETVGEETFRKIVHEFYRQIPDDPVLGPMYPVDDIAGAEDRLRWFLVQYWGGPQTFNEQRGHPRLRMRHVNFAVDAEAREHWLVLMSNALGTIDADTLPDAPRQAIWGHMVRVADMLINRE